jgi:hypothetical protein
MNPGKAGPVSRPRCRRGVAVADRADADTSYPSKQQSRWRGPCRRPAIAAGGRLCRLRRAVPGATRCVRGGKPEARVETSKSWLLRTAGDTWSAFRAALTRTAGVGNARVPMVTRGALIVT